MLLLYQLASCLGYFLVMLIFMGIAIALAKSKASWVLYIIGAVIQFISLLGNQKTATISGTNMTLYWLVYFGLLVVPAIIIRKRYEKANK